MQFVRLSKHFSWNFCICYFCLIPCCIQYILLQFFWKVEKVVDICSHRWTVTSSTLSLFKNGSWVCFSLFWIRKCAYVNVRTTAVTGLAALNVKSYLTILSEVLIHNLLGSTQWVTKLFLHFLKPSDFFKVWGTWLLITKYCIKYLRRIVSLFLKYLLTYFKPC